MQSTKIETCRLKAFGDVAPAWNVIRAARRAAEERADQVRQRLQPHQRDAHRRGRVLVLADRDPGAPEARVAQQQRGRDRDPEQHERGPVVPGRVHLLDEVAGQERQRAVHAVAEAEAVDAGQAERAVRQVEAADVVAVAHELRDDLAEAERHDGEVVAAQAQRGQADQHAEQGREDRGDQDHAPGREVDPERALGHRAAEDPAARAVQAAAELLRRQPAGHVGAAGEERHVAEVEQAGVADDDVQPDAHDRERDDHERRRGVGDPLRRLRQDVVVEPRVEHEQGEQHAERRARSQARRDLLPHARVESASPSRPWGRKTRIRMSRMKTIDSVQSGPGVCQERPLLKFSIRPIM